MSNTARADESELHDYSDPTFISRRYRSVECHKNRQCHIHNFLIFADSPKFATYVLGDVGKPTPLNLRGQLLKSELVFIDFVTQGREQVRVWHLVSSVDETSVAGGLVFKWQNAWEGADTVGKYSAKLLILIGGNGDFLTVRLGCFFLFYQYVTCIQKSL